MIGACRDMTDYRRATEWIEATERYCSRNNVDGFPGICGSIAPRLPPCPAPGSAAEQELVRATDELKQVQRRAAGGRRAGTRSATSGG
jgi:hypothetical protein